MRVKSIALAALMCAGHASAAIFAGDTTGGPTFYNEVSGRQLNLICGLGGLTVPMPEPETDVTLLAGLSV